MSENTIKNFIQKAMNRIFSRKIPVKSIYAEFAPLEDEIADKFGELGGVYKQFSERTRHKFVLYPTVFNKDLCEKLLGKEFISSWDITEEKVDSNPITFKDRYEKRITGYVKKKPDK